MTLLSGLTERQLLMITIAMVAVCVTVLGIGIGHGRLKRSRIIKEARDVREDLRELPELRKEIKRLEEERDSMTALADEIKKILPAEEDAEEHNLRGMISMFADQAGLEWISFRRKGGRLAHAARRSLGKLPYIKEDYELEVTGGFHSLGTFVNKLEEECSRLLWVERIKIEGAEGGLNPEKDDHEISITLAAFKFRKPAQPPAPR